MENKLDNATGNLVCLVSSTTQLFMTLLFSVFIAKKYFLFVLLRGESKFLFWQTEFTEFHNGVTRIEGVLKVHVLLLVFGKPWYP